MQLKNLLLGQWEGLGFKRAVILAGLGAALALFAASNFSLTSLEIFGRYIPEPLLGIWLIAGVKLWPELGLAFTSIVRSKYFVLTTSFIILVGAIGILNGNGFQAVYGDVRATALLILAFSLSIYKWQNSAEWEWFLFVVFATACALDTLRPQIYDLEIQTGTIKTSMSFWAAVGIAIIGFRRGSIFMFIIALGFSVYFAKTGFFRLYFFGPPVICLLMLIGGLQLTRRGGISLATGGILLALTIAAVIFGVSRFWGVVDSLSETVAGRMHAVDRTNQLIEGLREGDVSVESERYESFKSVLLQPYRFILPYGSGWRGTLDAINRHFGAQSIISTMDSAFFYISFHYGILTFYAFVCLSFLYLWKLLREHGIGFGLFAAILILGLAGINLFTEAGMFTVVPRAIQFGLALGLIYHSISPKVRAIRRSPIFRTRNA